MFGVQLFNDDTQGLFQLLEGGAVQTANGISVFPLVAYTIMHT